MKKILASAIILGALVASTAGSIAATGMYRAPTQSDQVIGVWSDKNAGQTR